MLNCKQTSELLSLQKEKHLVLSQRLQVKLHLMVCPRCRAFNKNNKNLDKLLKEFCEKEGL